MENELNQPQSTDLVLVGLEGVKKRLVSDSVEQQIAAIAEAVNYGQEGLALVIEVLKEPSSPTIESIAYLLLKERAEPQVKEALRQYYGEKLKYYDPAQEWILGAFIRLRKPIQDIIGYQLLILEGLRDDPEDLQELHELAYESARDLADALIDLEEIARIEIYQRSFELGEVKLDEVFEDVDEFRISAQKNHTSLSLQIPNNPEKIILYGNLYKLQKVMLHLVNNAIKFTSNGEIKISAEVIDKKVRVDNREFLYVLKIAITDTGCGVTLKVQKYLFKIVKPNPNTLFTRIPKLGDDRSHTTYHYHYGCGRGLAHSKSLVEAMGGEINFYSQGEYLGSTVTFTIPISGLLK